MEDGYRFIENINHQQAIQQTLYDMNKVLSSAGLFITTLTKMDRYWQNSRKNGHMLNWKAIFRFIEKSNATYKSLPFVFRWREFPLARAGFCLCGYHEASHTIELIALESFVRKNKEHPLNENMFECCLNVIYRYGVNLVIFGVSPNENMTVKISQAVNDKLIEFYIRHASFEVIAGTMDCITDFASIKKYIHK